MFLSRELIKILNLILCLLEISKFFICARVNQVAFLSEVWKKLFVWSSLLFTVFVLEMREREACRKQMGQKVSVLLYKVSALHDRFIQA